MVRRRLLRLEFVRATEDPADTWGDNLMGIVLCLLAVVGCVVLGIRIVLGLLGWV